MENINNNNMAVHSDSFLSDFLIVVGEYPLSDKQWREERRLVKCAFGQKAAAAGRASMKQNASFHETHKLNIYQEK
jgi:hypothetical protein